MCMETCATGVFCHWISDLWISGSLHRVLGDMVDDNATTRFARFDATSISFFPQGDKVKEPGIAAHGGGQNG